MGVGIALELAVVVLLGPAALAARCGCRLTDATPRNALVFGSGLLRVAQMSRAGLWLNFMAIAAITGFAYAILVPLLGVEL